MPLVSAAIAPHGDVIEEIAPDPGFGAVTRAALEELGRRHAASDPEATVVFTPHGIHVRGALAVVVASRLDGTMSGPHGGIELSCPVDRELAAAVCDALGEAGIPVAAVSFGGNVAAEASMPMDWGLLVPLWFLGGRASPPLPVVAVSPARDLSPEAHVRAGEAVARAAGSKRVAVVASADHGHGHRADGPYGFHPASAEYDDLIVRLVAEKPARRAGRARSGLRRRGSGGQLVAAADAARRTRRPRAPRSAQLRGPDLLRHAVRGFRSGMKLEGIHHITCMTADAPGNVEFYAGLLGLRLVKKTVNQDDPTVYHLFYADEQGSAGADLTFFEYPGLPPGRAGAGMVHRIVWRVGSGDAVDFWEKRLREAGVASEREPDRLRFADPEGLGLELAVVETPDEPLVADHPGIPAELALQGFDGVRAYSAEPDASRAFLDRLGFEERGAGSWESRGELRGSFYGYDRSSERGIGGAGTVHHVAWASTIAEHEAWRRVAAEAGAQPTPVIDRFYFRSIYFREPSGVLFEIATIGPGFAVDEPAGHLGESLSLPPAFEHLRDRLEHVLTPLPDPRRAAG